MSPSRVPGSAKWIATGLAVSLCVALLGCAGSSKSADSGFASPELAVEAFAPGDIPDVEPWNIDDGACRILLVGDSIVEAVEKSQEEAFTYLGCESIVDGLASRSLSRGWQCLGNGGRSMEIVLRPTPEPGNATCRPSGLELLGIWSSLTRSASAIVIALGTNDAGMFTAQGWIQRWVRVVDMTEGPLVFVTAAARPGDPWVDRVGAYNSTLRSWCAQEPRCTLAEWDRTGPAQNPNSYVDHVHLTRAAGEMRAVFIAAVARTVAVPAPGGPQRWVAPTISLPPAPSTTTVESSSDPSALPTSTGVTSSSLPATTVSPSPPASTDPSTTTTSSVPVEVLEPE